MPTLEMEKLKAGSRTGKRDKTLPYSQYIVELKRGSMPPSEESRPSRAKANPSLGAALDALEQSFRAGKIVLLSAEERRAQLDQTIESAKALRNRGNAAKGLNL